MAPAQIKLSGTHCAVLIEGRVIVHPIEVCHTGLACAAQPWLPHCSPRMHACSPRATPSQDAQPQLQRKFKSWHLTRVLPHLTHRSSPAAPMTTLTRCCPPRAASRSHSPAWPSRVTSSSQAHARSARPLCHGPALRPLLSSQHPASIRQRPLSAPRLLLYLTSLCCASHACAETLCCNAPMAPTGRALLLPGHRRVARERLPARRGRHPQAVPAGGCADKTA